MGSAPAGSRLVSGVQIALLCCALHACVLVAEPLPPTRPTGCRECLSRREQHRRWRPSSSQVRPGPAACHHCSYSQSQSRALPPALAVEGMQRCSIISCTATDLLLAALCCCCRLGGRGAGPCCARPLAARQNRQAGAAGCQRRRGAALRRGPPRSAAGGAGAGRGGGGAGEGTAKALVLQWHCRMRYEVWACLHSFQHAFRLGIV